jgi:ketosteroid isomerase-like protein
MSQQNVEIVRRMVDAWNAQDAGTAMSVFDPAVRWHIAEDEPDVHVIEGVGRVVSWIRSWSESFDEFRAEPQEYIDGGDYVLVRFEFRARAHDADAQLRYEETQVYLLEDGRIVEVREYRMLEQALKAVGMSASQ